MVGSKLEKSVDKKENFKGCPECAGQREKKRERTGGVPEVGEKGSHLGRGNQRRRQRRGTAEPCSGGQHRGCPDQLGRERESLLTS